VTDTNKIHLDPLIPDERQRPISQMLSALKTRRIFMPPSSSDFNPISSLFLNLKNRLLKKDISDQQELLS
jgi:transposase